MYNRYFKHEKGIGHKTATVLIAFVAVVAAFVYMALSTRNSGADNVTTNSTSLTDTVVSDTVISSTPGYVWSRPSKTGRAVYQDEKIISEAQEIINRIPLPVYYSEYDGKLLDISNVEPQVSICIFDYQTSEALLIVRACIADNNTSINVKLVYRQQDEHNEDNHIAIYSPREQFTLVELKAHADWFSWERDYNDYYLSSRCLRS